MKATTAGNYGLNWAITPGTTVYPLGQVLMRSR